DSSWPVPVGRWQEPHARTCVSLLPYCTIFGIGGYMSGDQLGVSYMSSALARVIENGLPGGTGRTPAPSKRGGGCTFSVVGNAQSGFSAAAAIAGASTSAKMPTKPLMTPPESVLSQAGASIGRDARPKYAFIAPSIVK